MKKTLLLGLIALTAAPAAHAGGLLNNTSLHALYLRSLARNASLAIDATYYNPAGLVFTPDGWRFSVNSQTVLQRRDIDATFAPFAYSTAGTTTKRSRGRPPRPSSPRLWLRIRRVTGHSQLSQASSAVVVRPASRAVFLSSRRT